MASNGSARDQQRLMEEFPSATPEEWRKLVEKDLKGAPFEKRLVTKTYEGIDVQPVYTQENIDGLPHLGSLPGFSPYVRGSAAAGFARSWELCQELPYSLPADWNSAARHDLDHGQTALNLVFDQATLNGQDPDHADATTVGRSGLSLATLSDLATTLDGIDLAAVPLFMQAGASALPIAALLAALVQQQGQDPAQLSGCVAMDPLGVLARDGTLPLSLDRAYAEMAQLTGWALEHAPKLQTIAVSGHPYHDGGGSAVHELGFVIATAVAYLRAMQERGLDIQQTAPQVRASFSVSPNFFTELAKLRAARLLWAQVVAAFGGDEAAQKLNIHVRSSRWNTTALDPYVNMLRATVEAFAGIAGSANSIHVSSFDAAIQPPDEFARRIARNTQLVLDAEAHLGKVSDPAGGSWYVEYLTDAIARKAWELFQEVERQGGMAQALQAGFPQQLVAQTAAQRSAALATRRDILVGVNRYANIQEKAVPDHQPDYAAIAKRRAEQIASHRAMSADGRSTVATKIEQLHNAATLDGAIAAALAGATLGEITAALRADDSARPTITPISQVRGSEPFEQLRAAAAAYLSRTGGRPQVFLANMGPVAQHKARADFATDFFQIGGFAVLNNMGFTTVEEAAQAAVNAGAPVVVICSTDATYPELAPPLTQQIKAARPDTLVILAGYPADQVESHKAAGVDEFIHVRADVYSILARAMEKIGVLA